MKQIACVLGAFALIIAGLVACGGEAKPAMNPENPVGSAAVPEAPSAPVPVSTATP